MNGKDARALNVGASVTYNGQKGIVSVNGPHAIEIVWDDDQREVLAYNELQDVVAG